MLELLLFIYIFLTLVSIIFIFSVYRIKNNKIRSKFFYILSIWSIFVSLINITSLPSNFLLQRLVAFGIASLSMVGIFIKIKISPKSNIANFLVSVSTILSLVDLFL